MNHHQRKAGEPLPSCFIDVIINIDNTETIRVLVNYPNHGQRAILHYWIFGTGDDDDVPKLEFGSKALIHELLE